MRKSVGSPVCEALGASTSAMGVRLRDVGVMGIGAVVAARVDVDDGGVEHRNGVEHRPLYPLRDVVAGGDVEVTSTVIRTSACSR